jgi:hypothetical protein
MNKILILCLPLIILSSCQEKNKYEDKDELCRILGEITANDQKYRGLPEMTDPFFNVLDSLRTANNMSKEDYGNLSRNEQLEWGKRTRAISEKINRISKKEQDSLMNLQIEIDNKNTKLLMDIIREKGWVYKNELGCEEYVSAWIVFRHSQSEYWNEIREIIEKEKAEKRIGDGDYKMIDNHIKGRPMLDDLNITIE